MLVITSQWSYAGIAENLSITGLRENLIMIVLRSENNSD